ARSTEGVVPAGKPVVLPACLDGAGDRTGLQCSAAGPSELGGAVGGVPDVSVEAAASDEDVGAAADLNRITVGAIGVVVVVHPRVEQVERARDLEAVVGSV